MYAQNKDLISLKTGLLYCVNRKSCEKIPLADTNKKWDTSTDQCSIDEEEPYIIYVYAFGTLPLPVITIDDENAQSLLSYLDTLIDIKRFSEENCSRKQ